MVTTTGYVPVADGMGVEEELKLEFFIFECSPNQVELICAD